MNGPLDVSEFFGIPAASAAPESAPEVSMPPQSKARNGAQSDLLAQLLSSLGKFLITKPHVKSWYIHEKELSYTQNAQTARAYESEHMHPLLICCGMVVQWYGGAAVREGGCGGAGAAGGGSRGRGCGCSPCLGGARRVNAP